MPSHLIDPHGGSLVNLFVSEQKADQLKSGQRDWPAWDLTDRQLCDLELLMSGGFSPLKGFITRQDYDSVCREMRLCDGTLWPIPITLDVDEQTAKELKPGSTLALRDPEGFTLAALHVEETWQPDLDQEAKQVYGTTDL